MRFVLLLCLHSVGVLTFTPHSPIKGIRAAHNERLLRHHRSRMVRIHPPGEFPFLRELPNPSTSALQSLHVCAAATFMASPQTMDDLVARLWGVLDAIPQVHHKMFEASLATSAFFMWILGFGLIHLLLGGEAAAAQHRFDGKPPMRPMDWLVKESHKWLVPAITYMGSIALYHELHLGALLFGVKPAFTEAPTYARLVIEVVTGVVLYDLFFYPFHWSFHNLKGSRAGPWRALHGRHHQWTAQPGKPSQNAVETVQNSYMDAGIQVFINICVQQISPFGFKHPLSRMLHNLMVTYLLCEAHSGYDLPFMSHRLFPWVFGGPVRHERHHHAGGVYYHQFFKYLDDLLGFVEKQRLMTPASAQLAVVAGELTMVNQNSTDAQA